MVEILGSATGPVVHGEGRGKELGFPTANIDFDPAATIPADGVYAGHVRILSSPDGREFPEPLPVLVSVGSNVTFGATTRTIEAYVLDFEEDLYGCVAEVTVELFIRAQVKFSSVGELIDQMRRDEKRGREFFKSR
ncbi:riboflavin kinase [Amycolatopsis sp. GM8]|uniref:riboflavin kinase n=1 Tax=Amycolatopsis sp. GM8 TaxID=2896530 RepID=UPI001F370710|nr:riboflavin kinase [Amycolatopsis sp. GM8]